MLDRRELMRHALFLVGASVAASALPGCAPRVSDHYLSRKRLAVLDEVAELMIPQTDTPGARGAGVPASVDKMLAQWASPETQAAFDEVLDNIDAKAREMHGGALLELEPAQRLAVLTAFDAENIPSMGAAGAVLGGGRPPAGASGAPAAAAGGSATTAGPTAPAAGPPPAPSATTPPAGAGAPRPTAGLAPPPPPGYPRLKDLILTTYYLSEPGATQELRLEPVPGPWRGDIPFSEVGRSWAY